jgi:hypothetical protein
MCTTQAGSVVIKIGFPFLLFLCRPGRDGVPMTLFEVWFSTLGGFKTLTEASFFVLGACVILPCLIPLVLQSSRTIMEVTIERKVAAHVIML